MEIIDRIKGGIFGVAVGDALGVPVEFKSRAYLKANPITTLIGYGSWQQPAGTWSDDTSLTLCLLKALCNPYDIEHIGRLFVKWYQEGYYGAHHQVFDIGGSTRYSLDRIINGESAKFSGNLLEEDNGNGSLMRTLPLVFTLLNENDQNKFYAKVKEVSSVTHAHFRSCFSCYIYCVLCKLLVLGYEKKEAYKKMQGIVNDFSKTQGFNKDELYLFRRLLQHNIWDYKEDEIQASGYVLHALEASFYSFYNTDFYYDAVLKAVNLGEDTDTTGAITGGLAGLFYGFEHIPKSWLNGIARADDIEELISEFMDVN